MDERSPMTDASGLIRRRRLLSRPGFWALAALPLLLCAGWSAFWFYASARVGGGLDDWLARETAAGRTWACPERTISGFPMRFELSCRAPSLTMQTAEGVTTVSLAAMTATAQIYQPNQMDMEIKTPLIIKRPGAGQTMLDASAMRASLRANIADYPRIFDRLALTADEPVLSVGQPGAAGAGARAAHAEVHLRAVAGRPAADGAFDITAKLSDAVIPDLDAYLQSTDPASLEVTGRILKLDLPGKGSGPARLEAWRAAGGTLEITQAALTKGAVRISAAGLLALDGEHRLDGRLDTSVAGAEALLKRFGIPVGSLDIGNALGNLLGGRKPKTPEGEGQGKERTIRLPLSFGNGRVSVGPVATPVRLAPLY